MARYLCRLLSSFFLYLIAIALLSTGLATYGWYRVVNTNFYFNGRVSYYYDYSYNQYLGTPYDGDSSGYTIAIFILLFVAISFASLCLILNFVMLCADCCCRITKCMTVIPKIISGFATLAGVLADAACVVFLIKIYVGYRPSDVLGIEGIYPIPNYSFYLVALTGILLMVAGCIICGVKHATKVEDSESDVRIVVSESASQSQSQWATPANPQSMYMGAPPFYQSQQMALPNGYPPYNQVPMKIFVTHTSTQTM